MTEEEFSSRPTSSDVTVCAFALTDCVVEIESHAAKYLRAVHRAALELAIPNLFGLEVGGFWMTPAQLEQLYKLPQCYPANEMPIVTVAVEAYLAAQTCDFNSLTRSGPSSGH